jgi:hypothetical protein
MDNKVMHEPAVINAQVINGRIEMYLLIYNEICPIDFGDVQHAPIKF